MIEEGLEIAGNGPASSRSKAREATQGDAEDGLECHLAITTSIHTFTVRPVLKKNGREQSLLNMRQA